MDPTVGAAVSSWPYSISSTVANLKIRQALRGATPDQIPTLKLRICQLCGVDFHTPYNVDDDHMRYCLYCVDRVRSASLMDRLRAQDRELDAFMEQRERMYRAGEEVSRIREQRRRDSSSRDAIDPDGTDALSNL